MTPQPSSAVPTGSTTATTQPAATGDRGLITVEVSPRQAEQIAQAYALDAVVGPYPPRGDLDDRRRHQVDVRTSQSRRPAPVVTQRAFREGREMGHHSQSFSERARISEVPDRNLTRQGSLWHRLFDGESTPRS